MRISDWSSDVCSSDLNNNPKLGIDFEGAKQAIAWFRSEGVKVVVTSFVGKDSKDFRDLMKEAGDAGLIIVAPIAHVVSRDMQYPAAYRSEEHTSELQSLMRKSNAVFC